MGRYRKVDPRIWNDSKFLSLSDQEQLTFLYLLTHPNLTMLGMLRTKKEAIFYERGWDISACRSVWQTLCQLGLIVYDDVGLVWIPNFLKYNEPESPSVVKSWRNVLDLLPECPVYFRGVSAAYQYCKARSSAFEQAFRQSVGQAVKVPELQADCQAELQAVPHQEQEQKQEQEQEYTPNKEGTQIVMGKDSDTDSVCYEDSLRNQIEKTSALTSASNSPIKFLSDEDVLNELQLVVAIKQWCKPCGRNDKTKALAKSGLMTLRAVRRACEIAKKAGKPTPGYVLGVLDNYSKDPDESFFHELNDDGIDEAEIERLFAKKEAAK